MGRVIILTGAPETTRLDWSEKTLLPDVPLNRSVVSISASDAPSTDAFSAKWRQLSNESLQMRRLLPKLYIETRSKSETDTSTTEFLSPKELRCQGSSSDRAFHDASHISTTSDDSTPESLLEFYDHSISIHEAIPSSELSDLSDITP